MAEMLEARIVATRVLCDALHAISEAEGEIEVVS
jgi:hypothetical protein